VTENTTNTIIERGRLSPLAIPKGITLKELHQQLRNRGCSGCRLGEQEHLRGPVLYRGNEFSKWAIWGESPGKKEDERGTPFCGPAGKLLDQMLSYLNLSPELQPLISNSGLCRPIAPAGSGKENLKPQEIDPDAISKCRPWIRYELEKANVCFVVCAGRTALEAFIPNIKKSASFTSLPSKVFLNLQDWPGIAFYPIYHPAFLLRKKNDPEAYKPYQEKTKELLDTIKEIIVELN
jgi:DNA polymerase